MGEKAIWLDIALLCCISTRHMHSHPSNNIFIIYYSDLAAHRRQTATAHAQHKGRCMCIFNELLAACLFPALDGTSTRTSLVPRPSVPRPIRQGVVRRVWGRNYMRTDPSTSGRKYRKSVNNAVFIGYESIFVVSAAATSVFQLKYTPWLLMQHG